MKITVDQIKKIIKEEMLKVLRESNGGADIQNITDAEDGEENVLPLQYNGNLVKSYDLTISEFLSDVGTDQDTIDDVINNLPGGDDILQLFDGSQEAASYTGLMFGSLDDEESGYAIGELMLGEMGRTGILIEFNGINFDVVNEEEMKQKMNDNGEIEVKLGWGTPRPSQIGGIVALEVTGQGEDADVRDSSSGYISAYYAGSASQASGDDPTSAVVRINKVLEDINDGTLTVKVEQQYDGDPIFYKIVR